MPLAKTKSRLAPYRGQGSDYDELMEVPIRRFDSMKLLRFLPDQPARYIVEDPRYSLPVDVLYVPRKNSENLLVAFHGAESKADLPRFQFYRSFQAQRQNDSLLFISDPTMLQGGAGLPNLRVGWLAGNKDTPLQDLYADVVGIAAKTSNSRPILLGHSAGGFAALAVGSRVQGSHTICVNAQLSVDLHRPEYIPALQASAFPECTSQEMLERYKNRLDLRRILTKRREGTSFTWFAHRDDEFSTSKYPHLPEILKFFNLSLDGGRTEYGDAIVPCSWKSKNPNKHALPGGIMPFLQLTLGESTKLDITYQTDPKIPGLRPRIKTIAQPAVKLIKRYHTPTVDFRGKSDNFDKLMGVPIRRFSDMDELNFDAQTPARYIVHDAAYSLPVDMLYIPRPGAKRLLVGLHGAESRLKANLPKFQFVRSFKTRPESLLFISDSTLLQGNEINIGWYAGNEDTPLAELAARAVKLAGATTSVSETVLVGHSAGGFAAILIGSMVPDSRAISINGQSVVSEYDNWTVKNLHKFAFPGCTTEEEMLSKYASRLDLRVGLQSGLNSATFTHFANRNDASSFSRLPHFPLLAGFFGLDENGGNTTKGDALVPCEWSAGDANPHAIPGSVIPFIERTLGEEVIDRWPVHYTVDPRWRR